MEKPESKNPLRAGKVIGPVDPQAYRRQESRRGQKDFVMSSGELREFDHCPHRWIKGYESDETKANEWGSLIDCMFLTPSLFPDRYVVHPNEYPSTPRKKGEPPQMKPWNRNATYCRDWEKAALPAQTLKPDDFEAAKGAVQILVEDHDILTLLSCSQKQVMAIAEYWDEATGITIPLKILIDLLPGGPFDKALADLKTCKSANPKTWPNAVFEHGYHIQAALYLDVYVAASGEDRIEFLHVLQESYPPWEIGKHILSSEFLDLGRHWYLAALQRYCQCLQENKWPGYSGRTVLNGWTLTEPKDWMVL